MILLTREQVDAALGRVKSGLDKYLRIQRRLHDVDVRSDSEFQKAFNGFYRVRRGQGWREKFFALMELAKVEGAQFSTTLDRLYQSTGRYEASFSSKLVATIDPSQPVIDSFVLGHFRLKLPYANAPNRRDRIVDIHSTLKRDLDVICNSEMGRYVEERFERWYPNTGITRVKMLDLVLWQTR